MGKLSALCLSVLVCQGEVGSILPCGLGGIAGNVSYITSTRLSGTQLGIFRKIQPIGAHRKARMLWVLVFVVSLVQAGSEETLAIGSSSDQVILYVFHQNRG